MSRMTKSEVKTLTKRLQKSINENDFLLDGVDSETSFSNGKTLAFVNKLGIDATLQMLEDIISEENYFKFSEAKSWWEDDAHVYVDRHAVSQRWRDKGYDIVSNLYVKVFKFGEGQTPWFVIHD